MPNYKQLHEDKKSERSELIERYKTDSDLLYLDKYIMKDAKELHAIPDIVNVTLNRPAVFFHNVVSALGKTVEQVVVESEDKNLDTHYVEDFRSAGFRSANDKLTRRGRYELNPWFDFHSCIRGSTAARCVFQIKDGVLDTEIIPWDTRYVTYDVGVDGLKWAAYATIRTKGAIEAEYGTLKIDEKEAKLPTIGKTATVLDVWHTEGHELWIAGKKLFEEPHDFGFTPVVIQTVVLGSMLADEDALVHEEESIFFLIRGAISELQRLISIMQTLNLKAVKPPMKAKKRGASEPPEYEDVMRTAAMTVMEPEEDIQRIDYGDAQRSATIALNMINRALEEGSLSSSDLGILTSPPPSGITLIQIKEGREQVFLPRLDVKSLMNEHLGDMFTQQVIQIGGSVEIGPIGHKRTFQTSKLAGEYTVEHNYFVKSPSIDAGLFSLAAAAGNLIPDGGPTGKRATILQREDWEGDDVQLKVEEAGRLSPAIKMDRIIRALVEAGRDFEAELLSAEMGVNLQQMLAGDISQIPKPEKEDEPTQVVSLFGGQRGRAPAPEEE